jgi:DNA-binding transcriptional MerR regulator
MFIFTANFYPMPYKKPEIKKLYYSLKEVTEMFDVNASLLRFWESKFEVLQPKRSTKNRRMYSDEDVKNLRIIHHLVKERGFTLQGAKEKMSDNPADMANKVDIINSLEEVKGFLLQLKAQLKSNE